MSTQSPHAINRVPRATYRLQLRADFGFDEVQRLVGYFAELGISDLYLSPLFRARQDSSHGYDVVDHATIEPEFGSAARFEAMARDVRSRGMGILLDVVPNHMGINDPGNKWWRDVLENGRLSRCAKNFDIDWDRLAENLRDRILLPVLGDHYGRELEQGKIQVDYDAGRFQVTYCGSRFPLAPDSCPDLLRATAESLPPETCEPIQRLASELADLPPRNDVSQNAIDQRYSTQEAVRGELEQIHADSHAVQRAVADMLTRLNGAPGEAKSFDALEKLLDRQWYRLANWRAAADEINYRRFFDINDLAAIRVEEPDVFHAAHALAERLLRDDLITGLRIDHPDGLLNPPQYYDDLQRMFQQDGDTSEQLYVVVEKILTGEEPLPKSWPVAGTTGYELLNDITRLLVHGQGLATLRGEYEALCEVTDKPQEIIYKSKKQILAESMSSEFHTLAGLLHRLSQRHRMSRDFTYPALLRALGEVIACFPVYRTYVPPSGWDIEEADYGRVTTAVRWAKLRNPTMDWAALDFIASVLLLQFPQADHPDREHFRDFVLRFQQVSGPVTAKGIEDTAFYRYYPLAALNEVGGELNACAYSTDDFHRRMQHRCEDWPHGLSATATHDTKRGEDLRARLLVLAEVAEEWLALVSRWSNRNRPLVRHLHDAPVPSANEEYLIYQTLVGTWLPPTTDERDRDAYLERVTAYLEKALREAKQNTSWASPAADYETGVRDFVRDLLDPQSSQPFLHDLNDFVARIADAGYINSLAQLVLKATVPGVPDFYQGCEFWDFNLVDPDNRRPVDYKVRSAALKNLDEQFAHDANGLVQQVAQSWPDPRIKLFITWRLLETRARFADLFEAGEYLPLTVTGSLAQHVLAFARRHGGQYAIVVVPLHVQGLLQSVPGTAVPRIDWLDTAVQLPTDTASQWLHAITGQSIAAQSDRTISVGQALSQLPVAVLTTNTTTSI